MLLREFHANSVTVLRELRALNKPDWTFSVQVLAANVTRDIGYIVVAETIRRVTVAGKESDIKVRITHTLQISRFQKEYKIEIDTDLDGQLNHEVLYTSGKGAADTMFASARDSVVDLDSFKQHIYASTQWAKKK